MSLSNFDTPMNGRSNSNLPPTGSTMAVAWKLVDIGTNLNTRYEPRRQIVIGWLLYDKDGRPQQKTSEYYQEVYSFCPWTLGKSGNNSSRLRKIVEVLIQDKLPFTREKFNLSTILGLGAILDIEYDQSRDGNPFATYVSMKKLGADVSPPPLPDEPLAYLISESHCVIPDWVPKFLADMIRMSAEWQGLKVPASRPAVASKTKDVAEFRPARDATIDGRETPPVRTRPLAEDYNESPDIPF